MHGLLAHSSILVSPAERERERGRERGREHERKMDQNCEKLEVIQEREAEEKMKREKRMVANQESMLLQSGL